MALVLDSEDIPDTTHITTRSVAAILDRVLNGRGRQAVLIGPGLGRESESIEAVCDLIEKLVEANIPLVIDADAIRALPSHEWPAGMVGVVTPHQEEMAHWLGASDPVEILNIRARRDGIERVVNESCVIVRTGAEDELGLREEDIASRRAVCTDVGGGTGDLLSGCMWIDCPGHEPVAASRLGCALLRTLRPHLNTVWIVSNGCSKSHGSNLGHMD